MALEAGDDQTGGKLSRLHVLILEDRPEDGPGFIAALEGHPDVVLADYTLPQFNARVALRLLREHSTEIPLIVVTGTLSEAEAAQILAEGADDYLFKDRLGRLGPAVEQAIRARRLRDEKLFAERSASGGRTPCYQVAAVASAEEALALSLADGAAPQVLIADVVLPGMRGDELASILRDRLHSLRVILASGYSQERLLRETGDVPAADFLHKPFSASALSRMVRQVLDR